MRLSVPAAVVLFALPAASAADLEATLAPLVKDHKGKVAVAVKHLKTGEGYYLNADEPMPTASLIKLPVLAEAYWQKAEGKVDFGKVLTLKKEDKVPGSGVLTKHFSDGATFTVRDAARLMIAHSDNTATNLVLDQTGIRPVNERMARLGLPNTRINAKVYKGKDTSVDPERTKTFGLGSTTAREMVRLLELIDGGKVVSPEACKEMLALLKECEDKEMIARLLPEGVDYPHKTGAVNAARTEAGIIVTKSGPVAVCVLTDDNADRRWVLDNAAQELMAKVGRAVYDHFSPVDKE
ncbi:MAG: class A beta-lactamase-related serine hydrolase [Gemmataceae bacterium]|nr:class A beta-lactamase-related serine hydrolase [Gemmataceae bacterium]